VTPTEVLSAYIDELLRGNERPLQEYLLEHPQIREELLPLLVGALATDRALRSIPTDAERESDSRRRAVDELAQVLAQDADLGQRGALTDLVQRLRRMIGGDS